MLQSTHTVKNIVSSQEGNANLSTIGGIACLAIDAAYVILADEVKVPLAAILALAGIAGVAAGALAQPAKRPHPPASPCRSFYASCA